MSIRKEHRTLFILYVLAAYILFQLSWWGYHIIQLNKQIIELKPWIPETSRHAILKNKLWMVFGESGVFFFMLALGFWYIQRTIRRELRLARMEKTFLLSVTHELKTPIAAIKLFLETLRSRDLNREQSLQVVHDALRETRRLQSLSENILLATRLDQKDGLLMRENFNFSELVRLEVQRLRTIYPTSFETRISNEIMFNGDPQLLSSLITNLLENAVKYAGSMSVVVSLEKSSTYLVMEVADQGIGIPAKEKSRVFEKFYRIGNEETRTTKGTGLGLFICAHVVKLHHGKISIRDNQPGGTIFVVTFPLK